MHKARARDIGALVAALLSRCHVGTECNTVGGPIRMEEQFLGAFDSDVHAPYPC